MTRAADPTFNTQLPADTEAYGARQRLRFVVPAPATTLLLGERWKDDAPFGYSGVSIRTAENFFVDVQQTTLFQGHQAITFQTDASWTQYSTGPTVLYARAELDVTSAESVVIAAVDASSRSNPVGADMQPLDGASVPAVASYDDVRDALVDAHKQALDGWSGLADTVKTAKDDVGAAFQASAVKSLTDNASAVAASMKSDAAASTGAGHAGIGLVSNDPIGLYGSSTVLGYGAGGVHLVAGNADAAKDLTAHASGNAAVRAAGKAELVGVAGVAVEGATAELTAKGAASVGSRTGDASVLGKDVFVGAKSAGDRLSAFEGRDAGKQKPTDNVTVEATKTAKVDSDDKVEVLAANKVTITVGSYKVVIEGSGMTIGNVNGQTTVVIKDDNVEIKAGPTNSVKIDKSAGVTVKSGANKLVVGPSGVAASGSIVKLG